jgi:trinucleotide repeat-containing gene 6 protein
LKVDSAALRSLCQQHGPLLTFQLNLRYGNSLIRYGNKDEAASAHKSLNGLILGGSRLAADFATDSDIGSFFEQNSDPTTTWPNAPTSLAKTEPSTQWPGSKPLFSPGNFSSELWSYNQAGGLASGVWSTPPTSRRDGEQSTAVNENGVTSPSMVTFLPPGLLNSGEST